MMDVINVLNANQVHSNAHNVPHSDVMLIINARIVRIVQVLLLNLLKRNVKYVKN